MVNFQNKQIFYTLKEYQNNYNILLDNYLKLHEDFDELMFIENELAFYNLCYINSNVVLGHFDNGPEYCINYGNYEILLSSIYDSLVNYSDDHNGFDLELSIKYKASFTKIIAFLEENKKRVLKTSKNEIFTSEAFSENLQNDPLFNRANEYQRLKTIFKKEYASRTAHLKTEVDFLLYNLDTDFDEWVDAQKTEIKNSFLRLIKEFNQNKTFFFGCTFDNYRHNYENRLNIFLKHYTDVNDIDFIEDELKFLENILWDIQNPAAVNDGCTKTNKDIVNKANEFVSIVGFKQYFFSHNKKEEFLNKKKQELIYKQQIINNVSTNNQLDELGNKKRKKFGIKKMTGTFNRIDNEQREIDVLVDEKENACQNDILKSTIEDYLEEFKPDISGDGYDILINALFLYFTNGIFPVLESKIKFKKINKKRVGWALKELYKSEKTDKLEIEYFRFAQENINLFEKEIIVVKNFNKSNFYKVFTTNPAK